MAMYKYTCNWTGSNYCVLTLDWYYDKGYIDISMHGYVKEILIRLQYTPEISPQSFFHAHIPIVYATKNTQ